MPTIVAGMHRSGTSMITRLLNLGGLGLGANNELLGPTAENEEGYFERQDLVLLSDYALAQFGGGWDLPPDLPDNWLSDPRLIEMRVQAANVFASLHTRYGDKWGWKDPRSCLLMDLWRQLLAAEGHSNLQVVVPLRHPFEVAASLAKRGGMSLPKALDLWTQYNERLVASTSVDERIVIDYAGIMTRPQSEIERAWARLGLGGDLTAAMQTVRKDLRHSQRSVAELVLHPQVSDRTLSLYLQLMSEAGQAAQLDLHTQLGAISAQDIPAERKQLRDWRLQRALAQQTPGASANSTGDAELEALRKENRLLKQTIKDLA